MLSAAQSDAATEINAAMADINTYVSSNSLGSIVPARMKAVGNSFSIETLLQIISYEMEMRRAAQLFDTKLAAVLAASEEP